MHNAPYVLESSDEPSFKMYQTKHNCWSEQVTGGHASCATLIRPTNDWTSGLGAEDPHQLCAMDNV